MRCWCGHMMGAPSMNYHEMHLVEVAGLPGVRDLPLTVRGKFAQALQAEVRGDHAVAAAKLNEAVAAESKA